jgi:hypothetical protein
VVKCHYLASLLLVFFFILATIASSVTIAYGHGIGADKSLPMIIANRSVTVSASLKPDFIESSGQPQLIIRTFDTGNNSTIPGIDYRVAVQFRNETLLNQRFNSSDGVIVADLQPYKDISGWQIVGKESASPDDPVQVSQSSPVTIKSRIFSDGGLYHIVVTLEQSSTGLAVDFDRKFDLYVTVGRTFTFNNIDTAEGKVAMSAKTYYDEIQKFAYNPANRTLSFSMPFTWEPAYVSQVPVVHIEMQFPKSIKELQANSYRGTVNGKDLDSRALIIDDYSFEDSRIVHFVVTNDMLISLAEKIKGNVATFTVSPVEKPKFPMDITSNDNKYVFELSWGPDIIETGTPTTFAMNIQDANGNLLSGSSFDFVLSQDGKEIYRQHRKSDTGDYSTQYTFTKAGTVTLTASNINGGGQGSSAIINLIVQQGSNNATSQTQQQQPSGCLIATAAFGSELTQQVQFLRNFRDHYILSTVSGSAFMNTFNSIYYSFSPQVADYERGQPWLQATVKAGLYPLFGILMTAERAYTTIAGDVGSILAGATASSLIGAVYLWPAGYAVNKKINNMMMMLIVVAGAALAVLVITLIAIPALLPISTSAFVIAAAGTSAIAIAKAIRYVVTVVVHRQAS